MRDNALSEFRKAETDLAKIQDQENLLASKITDDHIIASEMGQNINNLFPALRTGYLISSINAVPTEGRRFEEIIDVLNHSRSPQLIEFMRYDMRLNPTTRQWMSLHEMRMRGGQLEDPRIPVRLQYFIIILTAKTFCLVGSLWDS